MTTHPDLCLLAAGCFIGASAVGGAWFTAWLFRARRTRATSFRYAADLASRR